MAVSAILALAAFLASLDPKLSREIKNQFKPNEREILSSTSGPVMTTDSEVTVVKVKTREGIFIEIYRNENGNFALIKRLEMGVKDAYFNFNGQASNLALDDIDGDKTKEILVPMYDENLVAHLTVLKYDSSSKEFIRL